MKFIERLLKLIAEYEIWDLVFWHTNLKFYVNCNDLFAWGLADAEEITESNIDLLEQSLKDADYIDGAFLFCARSRKMRPQGAMYENIEKKNWYLFDECGPTRKINNPFQQCISEVEL